MSTAKKKTKIADATIADRMYDAQGRMAIIAGLLRCAEFTPTVETLALKISRQVTELCAQLPQRASDETKSAGKKRKTAHSELRGLAGTWHCILGHHVESMDATIPTAHWTVELKSVREQFHLIIRMLDFNENAAADADTNRSGRAVVAHAYPAGFAKWMIATLGDSITVKKTGLVTIAQRQAVDAYLESRVDDTNTLELVRDSYEKEYASSGVVDSKRGEKTNMPVCTEPPRPEQPRPEQPRPEQPRPEQPRTEQPRPEQPRPEQPRPEQPRPEQPRPELPRPELPRPELPPAELVTPDTRSPGFDAWAVQTFGLKVHPAGDATNAAREAVDLYMSTLVCPTGKSVHDTLMEQFVAHTFGWFGTQCYPDHFGAWLADNYADDFPGVEPGEDPPRHDVDMFMSVRVIHYGYDCKTVLAHYIDHFAKTKPKQKTKSKKPPRDVRKATASKKHGAKHPH